MLTEKYYGNFFTKNTGAEFTPIEPPESETLIPGTVIIEEQKVTTEIASESEDLLPIAMVPGIGRININELLVNFDGKDYLVPRTVIEEETYYGEVTAADGPSFANSPFILAVESATQFVLATPEPGTHTISAKIPDGKGIPKIIKMGKPNTIVNQVEEIIKSLGGTVDTKRRNLQNLISTLADMAENREIGEKTEVKTIRGTYTWSNLNSMNGLSVTRRSDISLAFADVPDDYQASENKIVVWVTNVSPINVVWSNLQPSDLSISTIAVANPTTNSAEFDQLTVFCTIYYW